MRKEILECDLCGREIKSNDGPYYHLERERREYLGEGCLGGPIQLDMCRYCLKNLIEPLGKWPKAPSLPMEAIEDEPSWHDGVGPDKGR